MRQAGTTMSIYKRAFEEQEVKVAHSKRVHESLVRAGDPDAQDYYDSVVAPALAKLERLQQQAQHASHSTPRADPARTRQAAEAFAARWTAAGGPRQLRVWQSADGQVTRVYAPANLGYLTVSASGGVSATDRGKATLLDSDLYPAWRRALRQVISARVAETATQWESSDKRWRIEVASRGELVIVFAGPGEFNPLRVHRVQHPQQVRYLAGHRVPPADAPEHVLDALQRLEGERA